MGRKLKGLWALIRRRRFNDDVKRELDFHIDMESEQRMRKGSSAHDARRSALRDFGGVSRVVDEVHDARGMTFWESLSQDVRFGTRMLVRAPGYTLAVAAILALGIGANTAMFSVINGVLLEPLPFAKGEELVLVEQSVPSRGRTTGVSIQEYQDYASRMATMRDLVEYHSMSFTLLNQGEPDRVDTGVVSANFFDMLGIQPVMGRSFVDGDDDIGAEAVLILSHDYWQTKFGGAGDVVGRVLEMNNRPHTVVGVLPAFPQYPRSNDVYMPTSACPFRANSEVSPGPPGHRAFAALRVFGRLANGATLTQATAELRGIARSFDEMYPEDHETTGSVGLTAEGVSLQEELVGEARGLLLALVGVTLLVLLISCANVANLALARTVRRGRELAVRTALGAGRRRLVRQLLTESLLLATAGGALGLLLAWLSVGMLTSFVGRFTPRVGQIGIDGTVLAFALVASVLTGLLFGLAPALGSRRNVTQSIRDGSAGSGDGTGRQRLRSGLVVAQVAVSFVLLVGAALFLQSLYRLAAQPLGYESETVITAAIFGNFSSTATPEQRNLIREGVLERLRAVPGVQHAALTNAVPQTSIQPLPGTVLVEGREAVEPVYEAHQLFSSDDYFDTLGIPLLAGRDFRAGDTPDAPLVAIINASMAEFWQGESPVGRRFGIPGANGEPTWITVIGIAEDFQLYDVEHNVRAPQYYVSLAQTNNLGGRILVRTAGDPRAYVPQIKDAVFSVDPTMPVEEVQTLADLRGGRLEAPGLTTALLGIFATVALVITLAGIAGVIGTNVSQRTREFGLRMALGASRASVLRLVVGQGFVLVTVGVAIGLVGAWYLSRFLEGLLFGTEPTDPLAYAVVAALFVVAAAAAAFGPARRATSINPLLALRAE